MISIRQSRYRDCHPRAVPDQGNGSDEDSDDTAMDTTPDVYGDPRYMLSTNTAPATPYSMSFLFFRLLCSTRAIIAPRAFSSPLYTQQHQVHSMGPPFLSSSSRPACEWSQLVFFTILISILLSAHRTLPPYAYEQPKSGRYQY